MIRGLITRWGPNRTLAWARMSRWRADGGLGWTSAIDTWVRSVDFGRDSGDSFREDNDVGLLRTIAGFESSRVVLEVGTHCPRVVLVEKVGREVIIANPGRVLRGRRARARRSWGMRRGNPHERVAGAIVGVAQSYIEIRRLAGLRESARCCFSRVCSASRAQG